MEEKGDSLISEKEDSLISEKEERINKIALTYYSRKDVQEAIFNFCKNRETIPRRSDIFGKRPDNLEYPSEVFQAVKKGWASFHCSEELWTNPLEIKTEMTPEQYNNLRIGWDLLIDIDSKYLDYSKIAAELIIKALEFSGIKNYGIKFSVSGDTPILIKNKEKISLMPISQAISLIKQGDKLEVLSLDKNEKLKFSKIYNYLEHDDDLYEIIHEHSKVPLKVTKHHSVFVFEDGEILEKEVSKLKKRDFLVTFNSKKNPLEIKDIEITNSFQFGKNQYSRSNLSKKIKVTKELMRLIGYYLSEGHVTNIINQVGFSFNKNEKLYINDCQRLLRKITNRSISVRHPNLNSTQILIHSKEWASFFENFCGKGKKKHAPNSSWNLSKDLFLEMLKGYIRGDGYKLGKYHIAIKSVAHKLIDDLIWLCKLNGISCSLSTEKNKPHKLPQGNVFKGSFVYILVIPKSELEISEFSRARNKFSPYPRDRTFPINGLKKVYYQIKPKMFNYHRNEQMTLKKKRANLERIKKVIEWFKKFNSEQFTEESKKILLNYESLFKSDIGTIEIKSIKKIGKNKVYDISVEETEAFFGNYYPILLHNSGSKGFHIIVPWKAFPKKVYEQETKDMFPEYPRIISLYLTELIRAKLIEKITHIDGEKKSYIKDFEAPKKVMPDIILVSPRHLFRTPYSLHEKTSLASIVLNKEQLSSFQPKDADPLKVEIRNFYPEAKENEAKELLISALDWYKERSPKTEPRKSEKFKEVIIDKSKIVYPPCINNILKGLKDGKKRALFILINYLKSLNFDFDEIEKIITEWNKKNNPQLKQGYILSQLEWHKKQKKVLPPNCDKDYYKGIGVCLPDELCAKIKNPVNYTVRKSGRGR